jgi:carboxyl-terminal processing protease
VSEKLKHALRSGWPLSFLLALGLVLVVHQATLIHAGDSSDELSTIAQVRDLIVDKWVEDPSARRDRIRYGAIEGMMTQLDRYSAFIPPEQKQRFDEDMQGEFGGLGIRIAIDKGQVVVLAALEDTPAWSAGLLPDDRVLEIDGKPYEFASGEEAAKRLKGKIGSRIKLLVSNPRRAHDELLVLERANIKIQSVRGERIVAPELEPQELAKTKLPRVGYLAITAFQDPTLDEFDKGIADLTSWSYSALVLDLRGNGGGLVKSATEIASRFLEKGETIFTTRGRGGKDEQRTAAEPTLSRISVPIAILLDGETASASEILAGALRDHGHACLVGSRSLGKGSVQSVYDLEGGKAKLKITTQYWYTPSGRKIHRTEKATEKDAWGLVPDVPVSIDPAVRAECLRQESDAEIDALRRKRDPRAPPLERPAKRVRDPVLDAAVAYLEEVLADEVRLVPEVPLTSGAVAALGSRATPGEKK